MGDFNPNSPTALGSEWRPQTSRNIAVSGANAVVQRFRPGAVTPGKLDAYLAAVTARGLCMEIVDTLTPALDAAVTVFPGTDTGKVGGSDWKDESSTGDPPYTKLSDGSDATYVCNIFSNATTVLSYRCATAISAGKRIVSIQPHTRCMAISSVDAAIALSLGGVDYFTHFQPAIYPWYGFGAFALPNPFPSSAQVDGTVHYLHPSTGIPWSLTAQANALCNGTDRLGVAMFNAINQPFFSAVWLTVVTCAENRRAFNYQAAGSGPSSAGWSANTLVGPNGAAISALSANTWYYIVLWAPSGASFTVPALTDSKTVMASAANGTGEHRQTYNATVGFSGILSAATAVPKEIAPVLIEAPAATFNSQSNPYGALNPLTVDASVSPGVSQQITSPGITSYAQVKISLGWVGVRPDQPLIIELRHGGGAPTGGGTLDATATVLGTDLASGTMQDITVSFAASFASIAATQYSAFIRSAATVGKGWKVGRVDTVDTALTGLTTAQVEGTGIGGTTDSYADTGGTARSRYDLELVLIAGTGGGGITPPPVLAGFIATPKVAL